MTIVYSKIEVTKNPFVPHCTVQYSYRKANIAARDKMGGMALNKGGPPRLIAAIPALHILWAQISHTHPTHHNVILEKFAADIRSQARFIRCPRSWLFSPCYVLSSLYGLWVVFAHATGGVFPSIDKGESFGACYTWIAKISSLNHWWILASLWAVLYDVIP